VNGAKRLALEQPRDLSSLLRDSIAVYRGHIGTFVAAGAVVVVPVELIVGGIGLEQLTSTFDSSPPAVETVIPTVVSFLVVAPLITAICIHAMRAMAAGHDPHPGRAIRDGFEVFTPLFGAIVLMAAGVALGFVALIVPGIYLAVRWFFVPQAVVIEDRRGPGALRRSGELIEGFWWRTFAILIVASLVAQIPAILITIPFAAIAESADRQVFMLIGEALTQSVASPFVAVMATLLYYDLRARRSAQPPAAAGYLP